MPTPLTPHDLSRILAASAKRRKRLSQWLSRNPLSSWHDPVVTYPRRKIDETWVIVESSCAKLRENALKEQISILPAINPYPDEDSECYTTHEDRQTLTHAA